MLQSTRPYGPVIRPGSPTKLKGAVLLQPLTQWPFWAQFWRDWDWTTIKRTIDNLATLGVNCLQVTATGLDDGYPTVITHPNTATMRSRIVQLAAYAASKNMVLNPQLGYQPQVSFAAGNATAAIAAGVAMAKLFAEVPNVAFLDVMNEVDIFPPSYWGTGPTTLAKADMQAMVTAVRAVVGPIPLTISTSANSTADYTSAWSQAVAGLGVDFHNVHAYTYNSSGGTAPLASDLAVLRSAPWYLGRFVVGEVGVPFTSGTSLQTSWLAGVGNNLLPLADCLGAIVWGATDTSSGSSPTESYNVSNFGIMDGTGTTIRSALATPVANWLAVL